MWRDIDPRAPERERPEPGLGRVGGYTEMESGQGSDDPRDAFTRDLDLPRGTSRERVRVNEIRTRSLTVAARGGGFPDRLLLRGWSGSCGVRLQLGK